MGSAGRCVVIAHKGNINRQLLGLCWDGVSRWASPDVRLDLTYKGKKTSKVKILFFRRQLSHNTFYGQLIIIRKSNCVHSPFTVLEFNRLQSCCSLVIMHERKSAPSNVFRNRNLMLVIYLKYNWDSTEYIHSKFIESFLKGFSWIFFRFNFWLF